MVSVIIYEFTIGGVVISNNYVLANTEITLSRENTEGNSASLILSKTSLDVYTITEGMEVIIKRGLVTASNTVFKGRVYNIKENNGGELVLTCYDHLYELKFLLFTKSYDRNNDPEAGEVSAIAQDIIENGGFTASVISTGTTGSDITVDKFKSDRKNRLNRLKVLSTIVNYVLYEDYNNDWIRFEPEAYSTYPNTLEVGVNVYNAPTWKSNLSSVRNKLYVDGAFEADTRIESFSGTGSETTFTLSNVAETLKVTVGGTLQVLGVEGSSSGYDYTHDKDLKKIVFESGSIPGSGTDNVVVEYTTLVPYTSVGQDDASIAAYGVTREESYTFKDIRTSEDADARLASILEKLKDPSVSTKLQTDELTIKPGQKVSVVDSNNPIRNGEYVVDKVVITYPNPVDVVTVGTELFDVNDLIESVNERLKAVESRDDLTSEILRQLINIFTSVVVESQYFTIEKLSISGSDTLYWDSTTNGIWADDAGTVGNDWADDSDDVYDDSLKVIVQGNNTYREFVLDSDFVDSATGVTVNTSNNRFEFVADGVLVLGPLSKNNVMSSFTLTTGDITGSFTYEVSNDDKSTWETVPLLGTSQSFVTSGNGGVYVRITESASTTATLSSTKSTGGSFVTPAVKLFLVN